MQRHYNYIIAGAGAGGLSLAYNLTESSFSNLRILVLDGDPKNKNDRTWSWWEKGEGSFDSILENQFRGIQFHSSHHSKLMTADPYSYKMIRSQPFYDRCKKAIADCAHIDFITHNVTHIEEVDDLVHVRAGAEAYTTDYLLKSFPTEQLNYSDSLYVSQHFGGWYIKTDNPQFDPDVATFMDFRIHQKDDTRFFYVLPISEHEALVEIAVFSNDILKPENYDVLIKDYISEYLFWEEYQITEREYGVIPMTNYPFWNHNTARVYNLGTYGGAVKPSSGYAFSRILRHADRIAASISSGKPLSSSYDTFKRRFLLYDETLLDVLLLQKKSGADIFSNLFQHNEAPAIFSFLDGDTTLKEEIRIFSRMPKVPFIKGFFRQLG